MYFVTELVEHWPYTTSTLEGGVYWTYTKSVVKYLLPYNCPYRSVFVHITCQLDYLVNVVALE